LSFLSGVRFVKLYFTDTSGKYFRTQHCIVNLYRSLLLVSKGNASRVFEDNVRIQEREDAFGQCRGIYFSHVGNVDPVKLVSGGWL
jgi:hypothetical protein